jgi:hypothetical protein
MYRRWLSEVWGEGRTDVASELLAEDLVDHKEIFRARDGKLAEIRHLQDAPGMLRQLGLEPPTAIMRLAARRSARRYRRELTATR